jgi:phosphoribosylanthranilate isomerase
LILSPVAIVFCSGINIGKSSAYTPGGGMTIRTRIKICGMTNKAEITHAVNEGVDALGFIFVKKSPRYIDPEKAREIISTFPPFVDAVGVFMNDDPDIVSEIIRYCGLTVAQLHGNETPAYCRHLQGRILKAFQVTPEMTNQDLHSYDAVVSGFLLDTFHKDMGGGTGKTFDWSLLDNLEIHKPVVLAGGLTVDNVGQAIHKVRPFAVDVNSGIETEPGRKDPALISQLITEVRKADQQS